MMAGEVNLPAVRINTAERIIRFYLLDVRNIEYFFRLIVYKKRNSVENIKTSLSKAFAKNTAFICRVFL